MMFGPEYPKIQTVFKRDERNVIVPWDWSLPEFDLLQNVLWRWTEKVDGTNIRIHFDGEKVTVGGRTDNAQVPTFLLAALQPLTSNVEEFQRVFPDEGRRYGFEETGELKLASQNVTLYGEGYGPKIQSGGQYRDTVSLALFDVKVGKWWLRPLDVAEVARKLDLEMVPEVECWNLSEAVLNVESGGLKSHWPGAKIEGIVGEPLVQLFNRKGERIVAKIKVKDFEDLSRRAQDAVERVKKEPVDAAS